VLLGVTAGASSARAVPVADRGVWADRVNRRRLLVSSSRSLIQALTLAAAPRSPTCTRAPPDRPRLLLGSSPLSRRRRASFSLELIEDRQDLAQSIALQSLLCQSARFVGPSVAGLLLALLGELVLPRERCATGDHHNLRRGSGEIARCRRRRGQNVAPARVGFAYAFGYTGTRRLLLLLMMVGFFSARGILMPIFGWRDLWRRLEDVRVPHRCGRDGSSVGISSLRRAPPSAASVASSPRPPSRRRGASGIFPLGDAVAVARFPRGLRRGLVVTAASINTILRPRGGGQAREIISMYVCAFSGSRQSATSSLARLRK